MDARNFRFLFENTRDGIVHSGCILDTINESVTNFTYLCGLNRKDMALDYPKDELRVEIGDQVCHIFVLASFTIYYIRKMLNMIRTKRIESIILPYLAPIQRIIIMQMHAGEVTGDAELQAFVEHPYLFLQSAGIENIYLIYGNGKKLGENLDLLESGHYFESAESHELELIREMEGYYVPVVKAGYIVENKWLFYFGCYGRDLGSYGQFSSDFKVWKRYPQAQRVNDEFRMHMRRITHEFSKQFGVQISSSIVMYQSPLNTSGRENDSIMTGKVFSRKQRCVPYFPPDGKNCIYGCMHKEDHALYRRHKNKGREFGCFGMLLLGNVNMNRFLQEVSERFSCVIGQIRAISLPRCGSMNYWNRQCLTLLAGEDVKYWICGIDRETSSSVISDVVVASPRNRMVTISEEFGYCFSGYLVPAVEMD